MKDMTTIDARGLSCPQPVLETKKALETTAAPGAVQLLVDTVTSRENIIRFGTSQGWKTSWEEDSPGEFRVLFEK